MGRETRCRVRHGDRASEGKALLETDEVVFRGEFRLRIPFRAMTRVEAVDGRLAIDWPEGTVVFELGSPEAERWAERITNPPSLMDKLGVKAGARVAVLAVDDGDFWKDLRARTDGVVEGGPAGPCDVVVFGVDDVADLAGLSALEDRIHPDGAIWAVWRKARPELTENHIRDAALAAGLVDVKVARFSASHSALKLVIPKARRGGS
ncbi:MAG: hypothetical protein ACRD0O_09210 [Acidimicrobiia bacterium]